MRSGSSRRSDRVVSVKVGEEEMARRKKQLWDELDKVSARMPQHKYVDDLETFVEELEGVSWTRARSHSPPPRRSSTASG